MTQLTEETFEKILQSFIRSDTIELGAVTFSDPYGMVGLLEIGELCVAEDVKKTVLLPRSAEVLRYLERMDFFPPARPYFTLDPMQPAALDPLLAHRHSAPAQPPPRGWHSAASRPEKEPATFG